jgi:hypothetical protein
MSRRRTNNIAALIAGFGTGYLNATQQKRRNEMEDEDRKIRNDEIKMRMEERQAEKDRENQAREGLEKAGSMKVGELRNDAGAIDNSEAAWRERIATTPDNQGNLPSPEVADQTASIYAQRAKEKGAEKWLSSDAPNAVLGEVKPTTKADIVRTQADAISKLGVTGLQKSMELREKAEGLDLDDLKRRIATGTPETLASDYDEIFPDGKTLKLEQGEDGLLYKFTEDAQGNKSDWQKFRDINEFKEQLIVMVDKNPDTIVNYWKESRAQEAAARKAAKEDRMDDLKYQELDQKIKSGAIELKSLPEKIQLDFKAKKASINASNASAENSRATAAEKRATTGGATDSKLPNKVREALWYKDANPEQKEAFDSLGAKEGTKVNPDGLGGFMVNKPDGLYKIDIKGNVQKVSLGEQKEKPINRPPLSSFIQ